MVDRKQRCIKENALLSMRSSDRINKAAGASRSFDESVGGEDSSRESSTSFSRTATSRDRIDIRFNKNNEILLNELDRRTTEIDESVFRQCFDDHWPFTAKAHLDTSWRKPARLT
ncbi:unnamed protein product [Amoebophrya sp. A25]|nr:unnamed protein product [Amoebophrya sp. A25]|eukprot:GSA25T00022799001.1